MTNPTTEEIAAIEAASRMAEFATRTLREQRKFEQRVLSNPIAMSLLQESTSAAGITQSNWILHYGEEGLRAFGDLLMARLLENAHYRDIAPTKGFRATTRGRELLQEHPVPAIS